MAETPLSRTRFGVLAALERLERSGAGAAPSQRALAAMTGLSVGTVNKTLSLLGAAGHVEKNRITAGGLEALEPCRAKRAVFLAAGFGPRLVPLSLETPRPLLRIRGRRIIDTLLDAVLAAGIREIYIVRGFLGEQFDRLLEDYPMIRFLENPLDTESNNITSAFCARHLLKSAWVLEADIYLRNPGLITAYQYSSNYLGIPVAVTDDWCFGSRNGVITKLRMGGRNCHQMAGISFWSAGDGEKLAEHIKAVYEMPGGKERYWDQVALEYFARDYEVSIRECAPGDIAEIDTYRELRLLDGNCVPGDGLSFP